MSVYRQAPERERALLADVRLTIGERIMLLLLPLFFLVPAVGVPIVFLYDWLVRGSYAGEWEPWVFVVGPLVVAALLGLLIAWILRGFNLRQRVYDDGYEVRFRRRTLSIAFDDVHRLVEDSALFGERGRKWVVPSFAFELRAGDTVSVRRTGSFHGLSDSRDRGVRLYNALNRAWGDYLGARHLEAIGRGERCTYGRITADREGLELDDRRVPWRDVRRMRLEGGWNTLFTIVVETAGSEPWSARTREIPDHPALRVVCAALARRR